MKIEDLSNEELEEFLEENSKVNQEADKDADYVEEANETVVKEKIDMLPQKEKAKKDKEYEKQEKAVKKSRAKLIKKRRKELKKKPSILVRYEPDPEKGLTNDIVEQRIVDGLVNEGGQKKTKSIAKIFFSNIVTFFNLLMFFIAGCLIAVGAYKDLVFLGIVTINILLGIIQEIKAKKMIDSLSLISSPTAKVMRDGQIKEILTSEVVLDDLLLLETGNQICADSIVVEGSIEVNESLLTGESNSVLKNPGDPLYSGSFVVAGKCSAKADKVGKDSYVEKLSSQAKVYNKPKSDLLKSLNLIIKVMAVPVIGFGLTLFFIMYFREGGEYYRDIVNTIRKTAGAMIGMIPSGLFLMSSIALFIGVVRLGNRNVLVQQLYCIEILARVDCLCLDKTGTITDGTMTVKNVIDYDQYQGLATKNIISAILNAIHDNNLTSQALKEKFGLGKRIKHTAVIPFSSQRKLQAVTFDKLGTFVLGAPEFVLKDGYKKYQKDVEKYASFGYRVLCLAHLDGDIIEEEIPDGDVQLLSMILIEDTIRPDAVNTIRYFNESGVEIKIISGDNPITVSKIGQRAGVINADKYVSLDGLSDAEVIRAAAKYTVFGRVSPKQKELLVKTLKSLGKTVAMTGDGVNDILALKAADCSIAVASGSDAARYCSHLVLLDSNFDSMPYAVAEGRRVINNVTKVSSLFLTKTIFSLFLAIEAVITGSYPISTNQLIMIDVLAIGLPSLFLVNEPNNNPVTGRFLYNVIREALPGALTITLLSIVVFALAQRMHIDSLTTNTIIIICATHTCLMVLFKACKPFNSLRKVLCGFCYTMFIICILLAPWYLEINPLINSTRYVSQNYSYEVINHYPSVDISTDGIYVVDGLLSSISANSNNGETTLYVVPGDENNKEESGKIYYSFSPSYISSGSYDKSLRLDMQVNIPNVSYTEKGEIVLAGYQINNATYFDDFEASITVDKDGYLYYSLNGVRKNIELLLTKNDSYYNYQINYGEYDVDRAVRNACIMPTIEIENGEYIINNEKPTDGKYKVSSSFSILNTVYTLEKYKDTNSYQLLVDGQPLYKTLNNNKLSDTPYLVELPTISTTLNKNDGQMFLSGYKTQFSIFDIYGVKGTYTVDEESVEASKITSKNGDVIIFDGTNYYVNGELTENFEFKDLKNNGFKNYLDSSEEEIDVYDQNKEVSAYVLKDSSEYQKNYSIMYYDYDTNKYNEIGTGMQTQLDINNSIIKPTIEVSEKGYYVIDNYYTHFEVQNRTLNPLLTKDRYLVIGDVKTDYKLADKYITEVHGGLVPRLTLENDIFLLMLCLLAAPLMKIFQYAIPWTIKQFRQLKKALNKISVNK